ncbi:hypothetical protein [Ruegeria sp. R14_0]|uniref:hypothetical protein n=1 Tax=Ruegeria sp. R14_0 TaxID=2821100 RepID=UPI001ADCDDED|nr:hypothetical protein [Ruegeria sp. R14_0]MBO9445728.1 hypothetical protein [Ruegeria sp. R14_0]
MSNPRIPVFDGIQDVARKAKETRRRVAASKPVSTGWSLSEKTEAAAEIEPRCDAERARLQRAAMALGADPQQVRTPEELAQSMPDTPREEQERRLGIKMDEKKRNTSNNIANAFGLRRTTGEGK